MIFRHDSSFLYLAIAKRFGVPYADVLASIDILESQKPVVAIDPAVIDAIIKAWLGERRRRSIIRGEAQ